MIDPFYQLWFAVRYAHVAAIALLAGGALLMAVSCFAPRTVTVTETHWTVASTYEWTFWTLLGVVAVTGVSNLGLKGEGLLGPETSWGRALTTKFVTVLACLTVSLLRSDFVIRCAAAPPAAQATRARAVAGVLYAITVVMILGVMWLGLGLAHGRY
jgi:hypothetical protein